MIIGQVTPIVCNPRGFSIDDHLAGAQAVVSGCRDYDEIGGTAEGGETRRTGAAWRRWGVNGGAGNGGLRPAADMAGRSVTNRAGAYAAAAAIVTVCTLLNGLNHWWALSEANVVSIYLAGVALTAARFGRGAALLAVFLSVLAYDYFFVPPAFAFAKVESEYAITLVVMTAIGLLISDLTNRLQGQLRAAKAQERRTALLYRMTREFSGFTLTEELISAATTIAADAFDGEAVIYGRERGAPLTLQGGANTALAADSESLPTARWVAANSRIAGRGAASLSTIEATFAPMVGQYGAIGALGVRPKDPDRFLEAEERRVLEACANLIAMSLERDRSIVAAQQALTQVATEKLRNSLLTSISHDLRSPLATIAVTAFGLLEDGEQTISAKRDVLQTIVDETRQLGRQVDNLLDLGRLQSSDAPLECEWQVLEELVGVALQRMRSELARHTIAIDIPADFPLVWVAGELLGQVLVNLLANAVRYTPAGSRIEISARVRGERAEISIADNGPGLPPGSEAKLFEKFVRGPTKVPDGQRGLGLGLAICRSIVEAHGGGIVARNRAEGGAEFVFTLRARGGDV
jgi:two-component system sensor histidine kinase KdpD